MKKLLLTIKTPNRVIIENKPVDVVVIPAWEGEMAILYNHMPAMVQLKEGILRYRDGDKEEFFGIYWGFAQVFRNNVTVLAEDASLVDEVNEEKARQEYERLKSKEIRATENIDEIEIKLKRTIVELKLSYLQKKKKG